MRRRQVLASAGIALGALAGCTAALPADSGDGSGEGTTTGPSVTTDPSGTTSDGTYDGECSPTGTRTKTDTGDGPHPSVDASIDVNVNLDESHAVTMTLVDRRDCTVARRVSFEGMSRIVDLDDATVEGVDYRFVVAVDGENLFDRRVSHVEGYELRVESASKVVVVSHSMA